MTRIEEYTALRLQIAPIKRNMNSDLSHRLGNFMAHTWYNAHVLDKRDAGDPMENWPPTEEMLEE